MPFYEYECQACQQVTEALQKMSDPPLTKCPECGKDKLRKLISASAFRLTGGGWYETDFKSDKESKRNLAAADKESKTEAKAETKTEAKPAPAADTKPAAAPAAAPAKKEPAATAAPAAKSKPAAKPKPKPKAPGKAAAKQ